MTNVSHQSEWEGAMTENKATVVRYIEGFNQGDREKILSCLTDDVEWLIPGFFHVRGKDDFGGQITNDAFVGLPTVRIARLTEEADVVVCEGTVRAGRAGGGELDAMFCDVFEMRGGLIRKLVTYQVGS